MGSSQKLDGARRPHLCLFVPCFGHGGTERQFAEVVTRIDRRRFRLTVACLSREGEFYQRVRDAGLAVEEFDFPRFASPRAGFQFLRLLRMLRTRRVDLLHSFDFYTNVFGIPAARLAGVPLVVASQRNLAEFWSRWQRSAWRATLAWADCVVANSHAASQAVVEQTGISPERLRVVHNGVDTERFTVNGNREASRRALALPEPACVVGVVAGFRQEKDQQTLLDAVPQVVERNPQARFLLAGTGPEEARLRTYAQEKNLQSWVTFLGDRSDIPQLLAAFDVAVLPTRSESFPNVLLEAMSAGRAVIASAVGGTKELIEQGRTGVLVPAGDPAALAKEILNLLEHPERRAQLGRAARAHVEAEFSIEASVARMQALYDELLAQRGLN